MELQGQDVIVAVALAIAMVKIFKGPIGAAIAERIRGGAAPADDSALAVEVDHLRGRLAEVEERLDFAERLLAQAREADQLHGGAQR
jgi:F0F1-type ATP synthase membrane subunit b/b'